MVFFTNLSLKEFQEFQVGYLALFCFFSVTDSFGWFWIGNRYRNIKLKWWCFSRLHSWSILFLLYINDLAECVLCNIAIHADDTTLHSKHLICGNNCSWFLYLNWPTKTLLTEARSDLLILMLGKLKALFNWCYNTGAIDMKIDGSMLLKSSFKMLRLTFTSKLDWNSYIIYIAKTASKKIGALIALYIYKSAILHGILLYCPYSCYLHFLPLLNPWLII